MVGSDESNRTLGVIPAAITWLYSLIEDCKQRTGARISVRVSAVEVIGHTEQLKDLLSEQAHGKFIKSFKSFISKGGESISIAKNI